MDLQFTPDLRPLCQVLENVPPPADMHPWPGIPVRCCGYGDNLIYSQRIEGSYYRLLRFHIVLTTAAQLVPEVQQRSLAFTFAHRGNASGWLRGIEGILHFREGHCYIPLLLPAAGLDSLVELEAGTYEATVILLEKDREKMILSILPDLRQEQRYLHTHTGNGLPYPPLPIIPEIARLLTPLTHFQDLPEHLPWVADECVPGLIKTLASVFALRKQMSEQAYSIHAYLSAHIGESLTADSVAHALHMNRKQLGLLMQQHFGQSFKVYLTQLRIERAKAMLQGETVELQKIALELGYSSKAHFSYAFRQHTGQTPSGYRASAKKKNSRF